MIVIGTDAHKRTHTAVATDQMGQQLSTKTVGTTSKDHLTLLQWARRKRRCSYLGNRGLPAPERATRARPDRRGENGWCGYHRS
jgi:hypothetical protein